jgi:hypothetical protein
MVEGMTKPKSRIPALIRSREQAVSIARREPITRHGGTSLIEDWYRVEGLVVADNSWRRLVGDAASR